MGQPLCLVGWVVGLVLFGRVCFVCDTCVCVYVIAFTSLHFTSFDLFFVLTDSKQDINFRRGCP